MPLLFILFYLQLKSLSFTAPRLVLEEWNALLSLSLLTEICINHWSSSSDPEEAPQLKTEFDPRPLSLKPPSCASSSPGSSCRFLEMLVNGGDEVSSSSASAALATSAVGWANIVQSTMPILGSAFPFLKTLKVCLLSPEDMIDHMNLPLCFPSSLRSLHVAFTDALLEKEGDGQRGSALRPWLMAAAPTPLGLCPYGVDGMSLASRFWKGLVSSCPSLTDLNIRRTWTVALSVPDLEGLVSGLPSLRAFQYCGETQLPPASIKMLQRLSNIEVCDMDIN